MLDSIIISIMEFIIIMLVVQISIIIIKEEE